MSDLSAFRGLKSWQKWTLLTIAAIVLQGVLNVLWGLVLVPGLVWLRDGALNLLTFGVQSFKNDIYRHVAKGFHDRIATWTLMLVVAMLCAMIGQMTGRIMNTVSDIKERKKIRSLPVDERAGYLEKLAANTPAPLW